MRRLHSHLQSVSTGSEVSRLTGECDSCGKDLSKEIGLLVFASTGKIFICKSCLITARRIVFEEEGE